MTSVTAEVVGPFEISPADDVNYVENLAQIVLCTIFQIGTHVQTLTGLPPLHEGSLKILPLPCSSFHKMKPSKQTVSHAMASLLMQRIWLVLSATGASLNGQLA